MLFPLPLLRLDCSPNYPPLSSRRLFLTMVAPWAVSSFRRETQWTVLKFPTGSLFSSIGSAESLRVRCLPHRVRPTKQHQQFLSSSLSPPGFRTAHILGGIQYLCCARSGHVLWLSGHDLLPSPLPPSPPKPPPCSHNHKNKNQHQNHNGRNCAHVLVMAITGAIISLGSGYGI